MVICLITVSCRVNKDNRVSIGHSDVIYSNILKEERKVLVYIPGGTEGVRDTSKHYPVLYLLDGDAHFHSVTGVFKSADLSEDG